MAPVLTPSITRLQTVGAAAKVGDYQQVAAQVEALVVLINHVQASITQE